MQLLKRNKNKSSSILKKMNALFLLGLAVDVRASLHSCESVMCTQVPAWILWAVTDLISWWESEENGKCCILSWLIHVSRPIRERPGPAGSKQVINTMWRRRRWCVQLGQTDGSPGGDRRREGELEGQETLNMWDRGGKPWRSDLLGESVSHQSILKPLKEGNLKPKILLASTDCQ